MGGISEAVSYTLVALGFVVLIFVSALVFVQSSRRGNRRRGASQRGRQRDQTSTARRHFGNSEHRWNVIWGLLCTKSSNLPMLTIWRPA